MTRKDYERAAYLLRNGIDNETRKAQIEVFVTLFKSDNPRFNERRFRDACEPDSNYKNRSRSNKELS